jgi:hypothetical protein
MSRSELFVEQRGGASWLLTTEPNDIVAPIQPEAMSVILTTEEECDVLDACAVGR